MILVAYAMALTAIGWTQRVRRATWRIRWELPTTAASLMLGIALVLIAPDSEPVLGRALFLITGRPARSSAARSGRRCWRPAGARASGTKDPGNQV
jgi:hypothetical protein